MGLIIHFHEPADGSVSIFLCGGERSVAQQFLNSAQVSAIGEKMRGEGVAQRVRMQAPIDAREFYIFIYNSTDAARGESAAGMIQKNCERLNFRFIFMDLF